jgi:Flp pilus assembly pilin Flp
MLGGFFKDETGASTLEYAFLVTFIGVVLMTGILALSHTVTDLFNYIGSTVSTTTGS